MSRKWYCILAMRNGNECRAFVRTADKARRTVQKVRKSGKWEKVVLEVCRA